MRSLFADSGAELSFELRTVTFEGESVEAWVQPRRDDPRPGGDGQGGARAAGPLRRAAPRHDRRSTTEFNEADDGSFRAPAEYLVTVARKPA